MNTGSPAAPSTPAVRSYLREFLSDRHVVALAPALWLPILHGIILRVRPARSARRYRRIWTEAGSPLVVGTQHLAEALATSLEGLAPGTPVVAAMRYGRPSIAEGLAELRAAGVRRVVAVPLFPQSCAATTGSVLEAVTAAAERLEPPMPVTSVTRYHEHAAYLRAVAAGVTRQWELLGRPAHTLISFHGIPLAHDRRDGYAAQCRATAEAVAHLLGLSSHEWTLTYQSRFGANRWLAPTTLEVLTALATRHRPGSDAVGRVDIVTPGFAVDCLETLDELGTEAREHFRRRGGGELNVVPCLGDDPAHAEALAQIVWAQVAADINQVTGRR